jgi:hypothetical protein
MKISIAIKNVERVFSNSPDIVSDETIESVELAIEAMEKQDPMKPLVINCECTCQMCDVTIAEKDEYCWKCGQKLDWED